jgi:hypothetical protein
MGRQHIAGALWLPVWLATLSAIIWIAGSVTLALMAAGVLFAGFAVYAFSNPRN